MTFKKRILVIIFSVAFLFTSCVGWQAKTTQEKFIAIADYYSVFSTGMKTGIPWVELYFPTSVAMIETAIKPVIALADSAIDAYRVLVDQYFAGKVSIETVNAKQTEIQTYVDEANTAIGNIKGEK